MKDIYLFFKLNDINLVLYKAIFLQAVIYAVINTMVSRKHNSMHIYNTYKNMHSLVKSNLSVQKSHVPSSKINSTNSCLDVS